MTRIGEIDELNAKIKEQLAVMLEKRREQDEIPTESKVQCLETALNMTLGDISKLQQAFVAHTHTEIPTMADVEESIKVSRANDITAEALMAWMKIKDNGIIELRKTVEKQAYVIDVLVNAVVGPMTGHDLKVLLSETEDGVITSEDLLKWAEKDLLNWAEK